MKKGLLLLLFMNGICSILDAQTFINIDTLFNQSVKEDKSVFMVFSGSDWCANCIRFEKNIVQDSAFQTFLQNNLLYLNVDFPQRKKQSAVLKKQNETLAEQYNPNGIFPTILLLTSDKKSIPISYQQETTAVFIDKMKKILASLKNNNAAQN
jgi:thiamine biosynthesis lipoprotein